MNRRKWSPLHLALGALFVALTAIGANITSLIPFMVIGGVPITLQTFFAILAGLILGSRLGAFSMFVYMVVGLAGVPLFAQFKGGMSALISPTFGFIWSFILVAFVAGKIIEYKRSRWNYVLAALAGMLVNYILGTNWMYIAYQFWFEAPENLTYTLVWLWMLVPLPKDVVITVLAGLFAYRLHSIPAIKGIMSRKQDAA
ncbi:biotin transporter BioY [Alteribacillus iranensis]|uniref:Biotin transporter n=1 Tax=Alteribacillus iranensis TaxID=930128 RepID=A0A1I2E2Q5_9BACI|nr:biotin transporter BioY [Alteribacillus iranensis]SFE86946.1 biotin transport system substrate-specific component [Alteribacillus iranensis]